MIVKVLIVDNYDSFTYNLYQDVGSLLTRKQAVGVVHDFTVDVVRNDQITLDDVIRQAPDRIIISPGPGTPEDKNYFGICESIIRECGKQTPLLGVCLGMQGIVYTFGGKIVKATVPMHGKTSLISHNGSGLFENAPNPLEVMRYHSLVVDPDHLPDCLEVTAVVSQPGHETESGCDTEPGEIMAVQHKEYPIYGVQYHPESFGTDGGVELMENFLFGVSSAAGEE
jgi:anthranilate synthase component 2